MIILLSQTIDKIGRIREIAMPSLAFLFKNRGTVTLQEQRMERRKREKRDWRDK